MTTQSSKLGPLELIVFDFDGTLCDSADVKTEAFYHLYLGDRGPAIAAAVKEHHLANVGVSRYDKIRWAETEQFSGDPSDSNVEYVAARYSRLVEDAVVNAPLFGGVIEFFTSVPRNVRCAVASATPTEELRRILERKGLTEFFVATEGSPQSKAQILGTCQAQFGVDRRSMVMVGDQPSDADAARAAGIQGLMITPPAPWVAPLIRVDDFLAAASVLQRSVLGGT